MTWLLLVILAFAVRLLWPLIDAVTTKPPPVTPARLPGLVDLFEPPASPDPLQPRIDGMVHYLGYSGRAILLESPRGVELELTGDTITVAEALDYLAYVDSLG